MDGSCLCGSVTWATEQPLRDVFECHCVRCRRLTGNHMAATAAPTDAVQIEGDELSWYSPDDDPNVGYGFCRRCGATLFFRSGLVDGSNVDTSICVGSIRGDAGLTTTEIWFADEAGSHVRLAADGIVVHPGQP